MRKSASTGMGFGIGDARPATPSFTRVRVASLAAGCLGALAALAAASALAQLPRLPAVAAPPIAIDELDLASSSSALALQSSHMDVEIADGDAEVQTTLVYRNDSGAPVLAHFARPWPDEVTVTTLAARAGAAGRARTELNRRSLTDGGRFIEVCEDGSELAEAGEAQPRIDSSVTQVAPGESIAVSWRQRVDLIKRAGHYRLVLPVAGDRGRAFRPRFSASVRFASEQPVVELSSGSHRARVDGVGTRHARLTVAPARAREGQFFALDFRLAPAAATQKIRKVAWSAQDRANRTCSGAGCSGAGCSGAGCSGAGCSGAGCSGAGCSGSVTGRCDA